VGRRHVWNGGAFGSLAHVVPSQWLGAITVTAGAAALLAQNVQKAVNVANAAVLLAREWLPAGWIMPKTAAEMTRQTHRSSRKPVGFLKAFQGTHPSTE